MTIYELAERDLRKAEHSLAMAKKRPNVPDAELAHIESLCQLRAETLDIISNAPNEQSEGEWTYSENKKTMKCTRCRLRMKTYDVRRYCPNCGAKMKGV